MSNRHTRACKDRVSGLTVTWQVLAKGIVNYTFRYSTETGRINAPPVGALEVTEIGGTSTILTVLERGTTY